MLIYVLYISLATIHSDTKLKFKKTRQCKELRCQALCLPHNMKDRLILAHQTETEAKCDTKHWSEKKGKKIYRNLYPEDLCSSGVRYMCVWQNSKRNKQKDKVPSGFPMYMEINVAKWRELIRCQLPTLLSSA